MISFAFSIYLGTKLISQGVNAANGRLVFSLASGTLTGKVLHIEDASSMRKGDESICRMEDDSSVFPCIRDEDILLHMEDAISRMGDDRGVLPCMGDEDEPLHMEDAASRMEDDLVCTHVASRSFRKEDETDGSMSCLDSHCKEDYRSEDPL